MPKRGGQIGNKNAIKSNRVVGDTLKRVAAQNKGRLRAACDALLKKAEEGDVVAFREFADRIDGKVPQASVITGDGENGAIAVIQRIIVDEAIDKAK